MKPTSPLSAVLPRYRASVEEQGAATNEIARNVEQAAVGTNDVSVNIVSVNEAAGNTGKAAKEVLSATDLLSEQSEKLRSSVESFLSGVKTA